MPGSPRPRVARLVTSVDFERALSTRSVASTAHFALHRLPPAVPLASDLSTSGGQPGSHPVDDLCPNGADTAPCRLGAVVPKRHAKRAVTRSLLKRQIYGVAGRHLDATAAGTWVVRLRAPISRAEYPSAASEALRRSIRAELEALFTRLPAPALQP